MSDRSSAWYADPGNRERRKVRMRAYGQALVALGQQFPEERRERYAEARQSGKASGDAQRWAMGRLRETHPEEFQSLFEEKLRDG